MGSRSRWALACLFTVVSLAALSCTTGAGGGGGTANHAPTAVATATPSSGPAPLSVTFSSAGSADSDGTIASYSWNFGDGSPTSASPNPSHTYDDAGSYPASLLVTDNRGATATAVATVTVTAGNQSPIAVASASPTSGNAPLAVAFHGSASHDPDGTIASYSWDFGDSSTPSTAADPTHTYTLTGTHVATLTVTDSGGATNTATVTITVGTNQSPIASATATPDDGIAPLAVAFDGSGSHDPDGSIASYSWSFGDGSPDSTDASPTHTYATDGPYTATLTVTDNAGATGQSSVIVTVHPNQPPVAVATGTPTSGKSPVTVAFDGSGSHDPDGSIASYSWNFGDGPTTSTDPSPSHTYTTPNTYVATLTVTDSKGATASSSVTITVLANQAPTAVANADTSSGTAPLAVSFSSGSVDPDGSIASTSWNFGDGSALASAASPSHVYSAPGTYTATLTVTDDDGATDSASLTITVNAAAGARYVATSGSDSGDCSTPASSCHTVQYAADQAVAGDTIYVGAGSYPERVALSKQVTIRGANAGVDGTSGARNAESSIKGVTGPQAGTITGASNTTYSGSISAASSSASVTDITGAGTITNASGAGTIASVTGTGVSPIVVTTATPHQLSTGNSITIAGVGGNTGANGTRTITVVDATHFSLNGSTATGNYTSGGTYKGGPVIITTATPHNLATGATVNIAGLLGNTAANGSRTITVIDATDFSVNGVVANATYTSGGTWTGGLAIIGTSAPHNLVTGAKVTIAGVVGDTAVNGSNRTVTVIDPTHLSVGINSNGVYTSGGTLTSAQIVITTSAPHGLPGSGSLVTISGVGGNTAANVTKTVTLLDATHFSIDATAPNGTYTGGGTFTSTPVVLTTATPHGLSASGSVTVVGVGGNSAANGTYTVNVVDSTHLLESGVAASGTYTSGGAYGNPLGESVTGATNAGPIVITTAGPHGLATGATVAISGVVGNTAANGTFTVTVISPTQFSLVGSSGNGVYSSGGTVTGSLFSVELDGLRIDPQNDAALLAATNVPLVWIQGGPQTVVHNSVFDGGPFASNCSTSCTTMTDAAFEARSGAITFGHNLVTDFRRPLNIGMTSAAAPITSGSVDSNTFVHFTSRAVQEGQATGLSTMPGLSITNNTIDAAGITGASSPGGIIVTSNANTISGNTISNAPSGVFIDVCKKWSTRDNVVTGNTFTGNSAGVYVNDDTVSGGQCQTASVGGDVVGTSITGNNFVGNGTGVGGSWLTKSPAPAAVDTTCNWWGAPGGPNTPGADTTSGSVTASPWSVALEPGGACTGS